jgi:hypothetical protein
MPSQLDTLYRFFKHEPEEEDEDAPVWNVSSAPFDDDYRLYRVFYMDPVKQMKMDKEQLVHIRKYKKTLPEFLKELRSMILDTEYCGEFRETCKEFIKEDPWLEELAKDVYVEL